MNAELYSKTIRTAALAPVLSLCLAGTALAADGSEAAASLPLVFVSETLGLVAGQGDAVGAPTRPMVVDHSGGLMFDLGGSDMRKLQLELDRPLSLQTGLSASQHDTGGDLLGVSAMLSLPLSGGLSLGAGYDRQAANAHFRPLGSIHCVNGTLRADSYTASGCRFVNDSFASGGRDQFDVGARFDFRNASASVSWFTQHSDAAASEVRQLNRFGAQPSLSGSLLSPNLGNPLLSPSPGDPLQYLNSEASGVDLNFKVGVTTDTRGDLQLGLAFSRILDAEYGGLYAQGGDAFNWTLAAPFNTARMSVEWSKGPFSTGIQGFYRDSVDFLDRNSLDGMTTFDVHFTWRTPWNANLSVGASNVLNAGADSAAGAESQPVDPLESIYGRIPYVRYKQDL